MDVSKESLKSLFVKLQGLNDNYVGTSYQSELSREADEEGEGVCVCA